METVRPIVSTKFLRRFALRMSFLSLLLAGLVAGGLTYPSNFERRIKSFIFYRWPVDGFVVCWAAGHVDDSDVKDVEQVIGENRGIRYEPLYLGAMGQDAEATVQLFNLVRKSGLDGGFGEEYSEDCEQILNDWPDQEIDKVLDRVTPEARDHILSLE